MTVISLTVLMGLVKEAVKGGEDRQRERNRDGGDDSGHLGNATQGGGGGECAGLSCISANDTPESGRQLLKKHAFWILKALKMLKPDRREIC